MYMYAELYIFMNYQMNLKNHCEPTTLQTSFKTCTQRILIQKKNRYPQNRMYFYETWRYKNYHANALLTWLFGRDLGKMQTEQCFHACHVHGNVLVTVFGNTQSNQSTHSPIPIIIRSNQTGLCQTVGASSLSRDCQIARYF